MPNPLLKAILQLKTEKEVAAFLRDLLTIREIKTTSKRFQMAILLYQGVPYAKIAKRLKVSTTTVTRTAHWLKHGRGGYKTVLKRLFS